MSLISLLVVALLLVVLELVIPTSTTCGFGYYMRNDNTCQSCPSGYTTLVSDAVSSSSCNIPNGLVHYWSLDTYQANTYTWPDSISDADLLAQNNGNNVGQTITWTSVGAMKMAVKLQNGALLSSQLQNTAISTRTLSWWVKLSDVGMTSGGFGLSANNVDNFESIVWNERASNQGWFFGSSGYGKSDILRHLASSTPPDVWHMITAVYASDYSMYVNRTLLFKISSANYLQTFQSNYRYIIGPRSYNTNGAWGYIDGAVGDVMVRFITLIITISINPNYLDMESCTATR